MSSEASYSASHKITVNAAEQDHRIRAVTIFQTNRAEVRRRVVVELGQGQNYVDIEQLPSCINEDSIHVEGTGSAIIHDVVYHAPTSAQSSSFTILDDSPMAVCHRELHSLKKERDVVRDQYRFLNSYGDAISVKSISTEEMTQFLDMFGPRQTNIVKRLQELDLQIARAGQQYETLKTAHESGKNEKRQTRISVVVFAKSSGRAEIMLTYVVSHANWTPLYDVHASVGRSKGATSSFDLHYRASITQMTGEHWSNVRLTLSTASPQLGTTIPALAPRFLTRNQPRPQRRNRRRDSLSRSPTRVIHVPAYSSRSRSRSRSRSPSRTRHSRRRSRSPNVIHAMGPAPEYSPPRVRAPSPMRWRDVEQASTDALNATFTIPGRSDIPSDEATHKVSIQALFLQAEIEWVCIPKKQQSVFLKCNVVNTSDFTLLPGEARVFLNSNFVTKTRIEHVAPRDSFQMPLGSEPALRVGYPPQRALNHTTPQSTFLNRKENANRNIETYSQRITITSPGSMVAPNLHIFDHVPVSTDTIVAVKVLSPPGLGPVISTTAEVGAKRNSKSREWVQVSKGVTARWAPLDIGGEGTVEWVCDLGVATEIELELSWEVSAPVGELWYEKNA